MDGGGGEHDIASFATDSPPGAGAFKVNGVYVILEKRIAYGAGFGLNSVRGTDRLLNVQDIIGSPYDDKIIGDAQDNRIEGGLGDDLLVGGPGNDEIIDPDFDHRLAVVQLGGILDGGPTLKVIGQDANDAITVSSSGPSFIITNPAGLQVAPDSSLTSFNGCTLDATRTTATCTPLIPVNTVILDGGNGDDVLTIDKSLDRHLPTVLDGGPGNDVLQGGIGDDFIQGGDGGTDVLLGGPGDDSLQAATGGDQIYGQAGNDLSVVEYPCEGPYIVPGPGKDLVGFAPVPFPVRAQIGGTASARGGGCAAPGRIHRSAEGLEGTKYDDELIGNQRPNYLIGRAGRDTCKGRGGRDVSEGCERRIGIP